MVGAINFQESTAVAQYYNNPSQSAGARKPLNQLPPIISSDQLQSSGLKAGKGLFMPKDVNTNLPPIVTPQQTKAPFVYGQTPSATSKTTVNSGLLSPQTLPPITQGTGPTSVIPFNSRPKPQAQRNLSPVFQTPQTTPSISTTVKGLPAFSNTQPNQIPGGGVPVYSTNSSKAISSSGVPIYSSNSPKPSLTQPSAPTASGPYKIPVVQDGSGTRSLPPGGSDLRNSLEPAFAPPAPSIESSGGGFLDQGSNIAPPVPQPRNPFAESAIPSTRTIPQSTIIPSVPGTNDYFSQPSLPPPSAGVVDSGCASCGTGGCYDPAVVQQQNGCCGSVSNAGYYAFLDAIFWQRTDGEVQLSNNFGLNEFNFVGGGRVTIGQRNDATSGTEFTYFGTGDLDESETATSATGALQPLFGAAAGISPLQISGFQNADSHQQDKETQLHSLGLSRVKWGWDVLKTMVGVRYIYFDDSFEFFSQSATGNGLFVQDSVNNLFGVDAGFELFYDVGFRTSASLQTKFGAYINAANVDTNVFNVGAPVLQQEEDDGTIASTIEVNFLSHFQLSPRSRFRIGYDLFLGWGLVTVENNIPRPTFANGFPTGAPVLTSATGTNLNTNNDTVLFHGPSFGFEVFR